MLKNTNIFDRKVSWWLVLCRKHFDFKINVFSIFIKFLDFYSNFIVVLLKHFYSYTYLYIYQACWYIFPPCRQLVKHTTIFIVAVLAVRELSDIDLMAAPQTP